MPIYEYECEKCGKTLEALQPMSKSFHTCNEIKSSCKHNGSIHKKLSTFAFSGSSVSPNFESSKESSGHTHSGGCGCFGTNACPSDSVRSKYGLD